MMDRCLGGRIMDHIYPSPSAPPSSIPCASIRATNSDLQICHRCNAQHRTRPQSSYLISSEFGTPPPAKHKYRASSPQPWAVIYMQVQTPLNSPIRSTPVHGYSISALQTQNAMCAQGCSVLLGYKGVRKFGKRKAGHPI
jgi:hypothetical protein